MADYTVASDYTVEDVRGLTVPKLKAELARLNQPLAGLKLKAQFADALTAYIEQQAQPSSSPTNDAADGDNGDKNAPKARSQQQHQQREGKDVDPASSIPHAASSAETDNTPAAAEEAEAGDDATAEPQAEVQQPTDTDQQQTPPNQVASATGEDDQEDEEFGEEAVPADAAPMEVDGEDPPASADAEMSAQQQQQQGPEAETAPKSSSTKAKSSGRKSRKRSSKAVGVGVGDGGDGGEHAENAVSGDGAETRTPRKSKRSRRSSSGAVTPAAVAGTGDGDGETPQNPLVAKKDKMEEDQDDGSTQETDAAAAATAAASCSTSNGDEKEQVTQESGHSEQPETSDDKASAEVAAGEGVDNGAAGGVAKVAGEGGGVGDGEGDAAESMAMNPVTIRVDNFVRPFTHPMCTTLLEDKAGAPLLENGFWMDAIKTHCYATFAGEEAAKRAIAGLQGLQWPDRSSKRLEAKVADVSAEEAKERAEAKRASRKLGTTVRARTKPELGPRVSAAPAADVSLPSSGADGGPTGTFAVAALAAAGQVNVRGRGSVQAPGVTKAAAAALAGFHTAGAGNGRGRGGRLDEAVGQKQQQQEVEKPVVLDELFRKTQAKPSLYWLPLSEEEVGERKAKMKEDGVGPRNIPMPADYISGLDVGGHRNGGGSGGRGGSGGGGRRWGGGGGGVGGRRGYAGGYGNRFGPGGQFNHGGRRR